MQNHRDLPFRITKVWAKNFRSIADASVDLDALTLLVGPNASGKSNVLDILRFIKDALRFDLEVAVSMRQGIGAIRRQNRAGRPYNVEIGVCADVHDASVEYGFTLAGESTGSYKVRREYVKIWIDNDSEQSFDFHIDDGNFVYPDFQTSRISFADLIEGYASDFDAANLSLPILLRMVRQIAYNPDSSERNTDAAVSMHAALFRLRRNLLSMRFYHIFPNTIREPQKLESDRLMDEDAGNLASALRELDEKQPTYMSRLKKSLGRLIPGVTDVEVVSAGGYLVIRLEHDSAQGGVWLDLSQESDGTVRLLGLLAALYQYPRLRRLPVIGIEEPELAVHPDTLAVLADLLNEASYRSQVIVTTHSPDFIDCITNYRRVENLRIVELVDGATKIGHVRKPQKQAVKKFLFSPGELHRTGELRLGPRSQ